MAEPQTPPPPDVEPSGTAPIPSPAGTSRQLLVEPPSICVLPGESAELALTNNGFDDASFTYLNAWIFDGEESTMFAARLNPEDPTTSGPLAYTTATTMLPIGPTPLAPGESAAMAVMAPSDPGEYSLQISATAPVRVHLSVTEGTCPDL